MNWKAPCISTTGRMALSARWTFPYQEVLAMDKLLSVGGSSLSRSSAMAILGWKMHAK